MIWKMQWLFLLYVLFDLTGGLSLQVVHQGIESVNGSNVTMGCTPLVGGVMVCGSLSYLFDSCSPDIDT
ncbi:hypothetical protein GBAR_LOCUS28126, partial [Geodia barretti]